MNKLALACVLVSTVVSCIAADTVSEIYNPTRHIKDQGISLVSWGSGSISEADETSFDGAFSLRVSTRNYFQGGIVKFGQPKDLSADFANKNNLLSFTIRPVDESTVMGGAPGPGNMPPGGFFPPGFRPPGVPGGDPRGGGGAGGGKAGGGGGGPLVPEPQGKGDGGGLVGGTPGGFQQQQQAQGPKKPALTTVRVIISTTDGKKSEAYLDVPTGRPTELWKSMAIPLQGIPGFDKTNKVVNAIGFSGDSASIYYVSDIKIISDTVPITGDMNAKHDLNLAIGDTVTLIGYGYGGSTILKYTWDFDDADGIQEDAVGQGIQHKFRKPGKFVVTLTVKDFYGVKPPFSTKVNVTVNP